MLAIKSAVRSGLADADPGARKAARIVLLVLQSRDPLQVAMDALLAGLEPAQQRHVATELQTPSAELSDLLALSRSPLSISAEFRSTNIVETGAPRLERSLSFSGRPSVVETNTAKPSLATSPLESSATASVPSSGGEFEDLDLFSSAAQSLESTRGRTVGRRASLSTGPLRMTQRLAVRLPSEQEPAQLSQLSASGGEVEEGGLSRPASRLLSAGGSRRMATMTTERPGLAAGDAADDATDKSVLKTSQ